MHRPDLIINAAAYNLVDDAEADATAPIAQRARAAQPGARQRRHRHRAAARLDGLCVRRPRNAPYHEFDDRPDPQSRIRAQQARRRAGGARAHPRHYLVRSRVVYDAQGTTFRAPSCRWPRDPEVRVVDDQTGSPTYARTSAAAIARA